MKFTYIKDLSYKDKLNITGGYILTDTPTEAEKDNKKKEGGISEKERIIGTTLFTILVAALTAAATSAMSEIVKKYLDRKIPPASQLQPPLKISGEIPGSGLSLSTSAITPNSLSNLKINSFKYIGQVELEFKVLKEIVPK